MATQQGNQIAKEYEPITQSGCLTSRWEDPSFPNLSGEAENGMYGPAHKIDTIYLATHLSHSAVFFLLFLEGF